MGLLPISYYPMPADDKSQLQVLGEKKAELGLAADEVSGSNMSESDKAKALGKLQSQAADVEAQKHRRQLRMDEEKRESSRALQQKQANDVQRLRRTLSQDNAQRETVQKISDVEHRRKLDTTA